LQGVPNAIEASREMRGHMKYCFHSRQDPLFGNCGEQLDETYEFARESEYLDQPTAAEFRLRQLLLPGNSLQKALEWQLTCARSLAETKAWGVQGITHILNQRSDRTSYEPYLTDTSHPAIQNAVFPSAQDIFGSYAQIGGLSPTDGCILARSGKPVLEIGPSGGDAHRGTEWVSERSVALTLAFYRHLIERKLPEYLSARGNAAK
jgi:hypothetical protein